MNERVCALTKEAQLAKCNYGVLATVRSHIASPSMSWTDQYHLWLQASDPAVHCCRVRLSDRGVFCNASDYTTKDCVPCQLSSSRLPEGEEFNRFLPHFLRQNPDAVCPRGYVESCGIGLLWRAS